MTGRRVTGILVAALCAFAASSLWYSPFLFGKQFVALSGVAPSVRPEVLKIAAEMLRNLLLAFVIGQLLARGRTNNLSCMVGLAALLWLGFPFTLLSGSVLWQNVPTQLALIHSGDWLIKILLMTLIPWLVNRRAEMQKHQLTKAAVVQPN